MAYGTLKCDNITFTNGGIDQTVTVSGIVQSISGDITATGTIQGQTIIGTSTVSGATVTGDAGVFTTVTGGSAGFTTVTGTTVTGTTANFVDGTFSTQVSGTTVRGTTVSGTTVTGDSGQYGNLNSISGVFTTQISGATITGDAGNYAELTALSGVFTTQVSGATVTGDAGSFTTVTGGVATITSGVFALGTNALPSISFSSDPNTGIYSPGADQVAVATNGAQRITVDSSGRLLVGTSTALTGTNSQFSKFVVQGSSGGSEFSGILAISRGTAASGLTADTNVGRITFADISSNEFASIQADVDGTTGATNAPGRLVFSTTPDGSAAPSERLRITSAGQLSFIGAGSTGSPAVGFNGSAPSNSLVVDSLGKVGVGTSSPGQKLEVQDESTTNEVARFYSNASKTVPVCSIWQDGAGASGAALKIRNDGSGNALEVHDGSDGNRTFVIDAASRVGIGTTSPGRNLHVAAPSGSGNATFAVERTDATTAALVIGAESNIIKISARETSASSAAGRDIQFESGPLATVRIDSSGRLLVGTSSNTLSNASVVIRGNPAASGVDGTIQLSRAGLPSATTSGIGAIYFTDNSSNLGAEIRAIADAAWTSGSSHPSRLVFSVTADGAASPTEALRISSNRAITVSDGGNVVLGTTTGTKIGTSTSQKIGFFNETPIVQPTTGVAEAAFVENSGGTAVNVDSTFGGYTIQQVVQALQSLGLLA